MAWKKVLVESINATDVDSGSATDGYVLTADGSGAAAWEAAGSSSDFHILADEAARDLVPSSDRKQGYLAYLKSEKELCIYNNSNTGDTPWQLDANWLQVPHTTNDYGEITIDTIITADADKYQLQIYDTDNDTYKKFDVQDLFGLIAQAIAQQLVDANIGTSDNYTASGSSVLGDLDGNGVVNVADMIIMLGAFGSTDFSLDWETDFTSDCPTTSLQTGVASYTQGAFVKLPFGASNISQSSTGFNFGYNDSTDNLILEDGTNFSFWPNLVLSGNSTKKMLLDMKFAISNSTSSPDYVTFKIAYFLSLNGTQVGSTYETYFGGNADNSGVTVPGGANDQEFSLEHDILPYVIANNPGTWDASSPPWNEFNVSISASSTFGNISSIGIANTSKLTFTN